jgi:hypothetical protein
MAAASTAYVLACAALIRYRSGLETRPLIASTSVSSSSLLCTAMFTVPSCSTAEAVQLALQYACTVQAYCTRVNNRVLSRKGRGDQTKFMSSFDKKCAYGSKQSG